MGKRRDVYVVDVYFSSEKLFLLTVVHFKISQFFAGKTGAGQLAACDGAKRKSELSLVRGRIFFTHTLRLFLSLSPDKSRPAVCKRVQGLSTGAREGGAPERRAED